MDRLLASFHGMAMTRPSRFFLYGFKMFFLHDASGNYFDAFTWGRRLAEVYCHFILPLFGIDDDNLSLSEMTWSLPSWIWQRRAMEHVEGIGEDVDTAMQFGLGMSRCTIFEDLDYLRWCGNDGAHVRRYLRGERLEPDPRAIVALIRVAMSFNAWHNRASRL